MKTKQDKTLAGSEMSYEGTIYLLKHLQKELNYDSQAIFWAIELLKRGEEFEKIYYETMKYIFYDDKGTNVIPNHFMDEVGKRLEELKLKYFPK